VLLASTLAKDLVFNNALKVLLPTNLTIAYFVIVLVLLVQEALEINVPLVLLA
jgi:hypothetical protein